MAKFFNSSNEIEESNEEKNISSNVFMTIDNSSDKQEDDFVSSDQLQTVSETEVLDENISLSDPLNNASNSVPVNPVAPEVEKIDYDEIEVRAFGIIKLILKSIFSPGTALEDIGKQYCSLTNSFKVTFIISILMVIINVIVSTVTTIIYKNYNTLGSTSFVVFDYHDILQQDWVSIVVISFLASMLLMLIVAVIYYISSFVRSKGVSFAKYLIITNIASIPVLFGLFVFYPLGSIVNVIFGLYLLGISIIYTVVSFLSGINSCLDFSSSNKKIVYNVINLSIIFLIVIMIIYYVFPGTLENLV